MKSLLVLCALALLGGRLFADIAPDATGAVLFEVCSMTQDASGGSTPQFTVNSKHPLLKVTSIRDLELGSDMQSVRVLLNAKDTKSLAKITAKYQILAFVGTDGTTAAYVKVTAPITDGGIAFAKEHNTGAMAAYLRQRFHLKPDTNQAEASPVRVNPAGA